MAGQGPAARTQARWLPHTVATRRPLATLQASCAEVYATSAYTGSAANLARVSLATDYVVSDGATLETPTVSGSVNAGYEASLTVGVTV
jgi:hypothetical protein